MRNKAIKEEREGQTKIKFRRKGIELAGKYLYIELTVIPPVGNRRYADSAVEHLVEVLQKHHGGDVAPIPLPHGADLAPVDELERIPEVRQHGQLVLHLYRPYPVLDLPPHPFPLEAGPPRVYLGHHVVPVAGQVPGPRQLPLGGDRLGTRTGVTEKERAK